MNTRPNATTTHPTAATLHEIFDGQQVDAATARHARDCSRCAHQLQTLANQRKALGRLLRRDVSWMSAAQRQGRKVLGDLLAELANACLARRDASPRNSPLSELPRPIERITADIRTLVTRLSGIATTESASPVSRSLKPKLAPPNWADLETLTRRAPGDAVLLDHCVAALRALEGNSPRVRALHLT